MASILAQGTIPPSLAKSTLHSVVACNSAEVMAQVRAMVNQTPGVDVIAECSNGKEALRTCLQQKPDLLFIDMQIGDTVRSKSRKRSKAMLRRVFYS